MESDSEVDIENFDDLDDGNNVTDAMKIFSRVHIKHQTVEKELGLEGAILIKKELKDDESSEGEMTYCLKDEGEDNMKIGVEKEDEILFKIVDVRTLQERSDGEDQSEDMQIGDDEDNDYYQEVVIQGERVVQEPIPETSSRIEDGETSDGESRSNQPSRQRYSKYPERRRKKRLLQNAVSKRELWLELRRGSRGSNTKNTHPKKKNPKSPDKPVKINHLGPLSAYNVNKVKRTMNTKGNKASEPTIYIRPPSKPTVDITSKPNVNVTSIPQVNDTSNDFNANGATFINLDGIDAEVMTSSQIREASYFETDEEQSERAKLHNRMEQDRRRELSKLCFRLQQSLPDIANLRSVSKLRVLTAAKQYCDDLAEEAERMECQITMYTIKRNQLVRKLEAMKQTCTKKQLSSLYAGGS